MPSCPQLVLNDIISQITKACGEYVELSPILSNTETEFTHLVVLKRLHFPSAPWGASTFLFQCRFLGLQLDQLDERATAQQL